MYKILKKDRVLAQFFVLFVLCILVLPGIFLSSCLEEEIFGPQTGSLRFSMDTLRFDTVFTSLGSATKNVRISNPSNENISIGSISFLNSGSSKFRMNVDGISASTFEGIEIRAHDSIHIFVEVTIDPDEPPSISPFVIEDAIVFESPGIIQQLVLEAWGQNANYLPNRFSAGQLARLTCGNGTVTWNDPKPYVIYGILFIDSCDLVIPPGTKVFVHGGLANLQGNIINDGALFFQKEGRLLSRGTLDQPVVFQGDRLENEFSDVTGQWVGLRFLPGSKDNLLRHTIIKNSIVGIRVDSSSSAIVDKSVFFNTANAGIIGVHADVDISNCLFFQNGSNSLLFAYGGNYNVTYTTIANYINQDPGIFLDNFLCRDAQCNTIDIFPLNVTFTNTIIVGSNDDEILFVDGTDGQDPETFNMSFQSCVVKIDELESDEVFMNSCDNCISASLQDSLFVDLENNDFHLHQMSPALEQALPVQLIRDDLEGNSRDAQNPDIGCYERK